MLVHARKHTSGRRRCLVAQIAKLPGPAWCRCVADPGLNAVCATECTQAKRNATSRDDMHHAFDQAGGAGVGLQSAKSGNSRYKPVYRFAVISKVSYRSRFRVDFPVADV